MPSQLDHLFRNAFGNHTQQVQESTLGVIQLKLIVMMISANGMVPAGFITFATHPKSLY
jgi:hypothetical protein